MDWVISATVPTTWRTDSMLPSPGERKSWARGPNGWDFAVHRPYEPGDEINTIDWFASAATGLQEVITRVNFEPRDSRFYVLTDMGSTMGFGSYRTSKRMLAAEVTLSIILSAKETADRVGFVLYDDFSAVHTQRTRNAQTVFYPAARSIVEYDEAVLAGEIDPAAAEDKSITGLQLALDSVEDLSRSLVFVVSDFMNMTEEDEAMLERVAAVHDVVCIMIQDLRERELPQGALFGYGFYVFEDMRTGETKTIWLSPNVRRQFAENFNAHEQKVIELFNRCDCDWEVISTEEGLAAHEKLVTLLANHQK